MDTLNNIAALFNGLSFFPVTLSSGLKAKAARVYIESSRYSQFVILVSDSDGNLVNIQTRTFESDTLQENLGITPGSVESQRFVFPENSWAARAELSPVHADRYKSYYKLGRLNVVLLHDLKKQSSWEWPAAVVLRDALRTWECSIQ